jgi:hypothetical protein
MVQKAKGLTVQGFKRFKVQRVNCSKVQGFRGSIVQMFKVQGFKGSEVQGFRGSKVQGSRFKGSMVPGMGLRFYAPEMYPAFIVYFRHRLFINKPFLFSLLIIYSSSGIPCLSYSSA